MKELKVLEDVLGLRFQLNSCIHMGDSVKEVLVVNRYNLLLLSTQSEIKFYDINNVINDLTLGNCLHKVDFDSVVSIKCTEFEDFEENNVKSAARIWIELEMSIVIYDVVNLRVEIEYEKKSPLKYFYCVLQGYVVIICGNKLKMYKKDKKIFSHKFTNSITHISNTQSDTLLLLDEVNNIFKLSHTGQSTTVTPMSFTLDKTLGDNYKVVSLCQYQNYVIMSLYNQIDYLLLVCTAELEVISYSLNELYIEFDAAVDLEINYFILRPWNLLIVYSNHSTSTLFLSNNPRLISLNSDTVDNTDEIVVLRMLEGFGVESVEYGDNLRNLQLYTNYVNEIYRKNSLADTPTMKNPHILFSTQCSNTVTLYYTDIHFVNSNNNEVGVLTPLTSCDSCLIDLLRSTVNGVKKNTIEVAAGVDLEQLYSMGLKWYVDKKSLKLFESLLNVLHFFHTSLELSDSVDNGDSVGVGELSKLVDNDYIIIFRNLLNIQHNMLLLLDDSDTTVNSTLNSAANTTNIAANTTNIAANGIITELKKLVNNNIMRIERVEESMVKEVENVLLYTNQQLKHLHHKLHNTNFHLSINTSNNVYSSNTVNSVNSVDSNSSNSVRDDRGVVLELERRLGCVVGEIKLLYNQPVNVNTTQSPKFISKFNTHIHTTDCNLDITSVDAEENNVKSAATGDPEGANSNTVNTVDSVGIVDTVKISEENNVTQIAAPIAATTDKVGVKLFGEIDSGFRLGNLELTGQLCNPVTFNTALTQSQEQTSIFSTYANNQSLIDMAHSITSNSFPNSFTGFGNTISSNIGSGFKGFTGGFGTAQNSFPRTVNPGNTTVNPVNSVNSVNSVSSGLGDDSLWLGSRRYDPLN
ncbi:hypothetical protein TpMuguga_02g00870 [Theileria parva strain Muguga]|uniref:Uncharacterized protein n=1 Tax=Theileria parva TaxID=5875 RepID=Q4N3W8_THEPA|nr:uncharacterized protein TpMuguga_02g00870 [Theileria parva strain Muguga]EAN33155.1 hypothetical protein TpMuguga_02g00870 [Theileria parva strain Muguga]|eukprot:XP_765438.1 hypothetical protein [Theileria parva strain Muguga]